MKKTGYLHDNRYLLHDTGPYHPEMAERLTAVYDGIKAAGLLDKLILVPAVFSVMLDVRRSAEEGLRRLFGGAPEMRCVFPFQHRMGFQHVGQGGRHVANLVARGLAVPFEDLFIDQRAGRLGEGKRAPRQFGPAQGAVVKPPQGLLDPAVALVLVLDGKLHLQRPGQEDLHVLQGLNFLFVHVSHHG